MTWIMKLAVLISLSVCVGTLLTLRVLAKKNEMCDARAREEFRRNIVRCSGYCEPLYQPVRQGEVEHAQRILGIWEGYMDEDGALLEAFRSTCGKRGDACAKAARWVKKLEGWGVGHDEVGEVIVVDRRREAQYFLGGMYEYGDRASVVQPPWYWEGDPSGCISSGIAQVVDHGSDTAGTKLKG